MARRPAFRRPDLHALVARVAEGGVADAHDGDRVRACRAVLVLDQVALRPDPGLAQFAKSAARNIREALAMPGRIAA